MPCFYTFTANRKMPTSRILELLMPSLKNRKFGQLLSCVYKDKELLKIFWNTRDPGNEMQKISRFFRAWDILKGRHTSANLSVSKHRFSTAMRRHNCVENIKSSDKKFRYFRIVNYKENEILGVGRFKRSP
ncbi:uncharacterized protein LOC129975040 [Argiope bruennichi]|uniref:uncharacterized protein LOC129975040 n=1 Tax=Argiope bruennichi TaxID=94029 RepID=UPI0024946C2B|nr:uncharacterized protein LOC129975040 [Argiope bruennichi]